MDYREILTTQSGSVATITLNRPEKLNAWTMQMESEFEDAVHRAAGDESVRAIVLTGAGRGFCAGADMSLLQDVIGQREGQREVRQWTWLLNVPKPIIALVNGPCVGLGLVIAAFCDLRLAAPEATFSTVFARRGLVAEYGLAWMLPRLVGTGNAMDLLLSARTIDAAEAERIGLAKAMPADAALAYVHQLADSNSPRSLRIIKQQIHAGIAQSLRESVELAVREMWASFATEDFREGVAHFMEKRPPRFTGK